jgi:hypothetical protein
MIFSEDYQIRAFCLTVKISSLGVVHNVEHIGCFHCPSGVNIMPPQKWSSSQASLLCSLHSATPITNQITQVCHEV